MPLNTSQPNVANDDFEQISFNRRKTSFNKTRQIQKRIDHMSENLNNISKELFMYYIHNNIDSSRNVKNLKYKSNDLAISKCIITEYTLSIPI